MKTKLASIFVLATLLSANAQNAFAKEQKNYDWIIRGRALYVKTDIKSSVSGLGGGVATSSDQVPELDFTRFFTPNIAAELILATTKHDVNLRGSGALSNQKLGSVNLLPPTLTLQYHVNPTGKIRPYFGAGLNYTFFYGSKNAGVVDKVKYKDNLGYALQVGFDYMIDDRFGVNFDVKKIFLKTTAQINDAYTAKVRLDPWLIGAGMSYRF